MDPPPHLIKKNENPFLTPKKKSRSKSSSSKRSRKSKTPTTEKAQTEGQGLTKGEGLTKGQGLTEGQRQRQGQRQTQRQGERQGQRQRQGLTEGERQRQGLLIPLTPGQGQSTQGQITTGQITPGQLTPGQLTQTQEKRRNPFLEPRPTVKRHDDRDRNVRNNDRNHRKTANPFVKESGLGTALGTGLGLGTTGLGTTGLGTTALGLGTALGKESEPPKLVINVDDTAEFPSLQSPKTASPNPIQNPVWGGKPRLNFKEVALKGEKEKEQQQQQQQQPQQQSQPQPQQQQQQSQPQPQQQCPTNEKKQNAETTHNIADIARHVVRHNIFNPAIVTMDTGASVLTDYSIQRERINQNMFMTPQKHYNKPPQPRYTMNEDADNESRYFEDDGFDRIYNNT